MKTLRYFSLVSLVALLLLAACGSPGASGPLPRLGSLSRIGGSVQIRMGDTGDFAEAANASVWEVGAQLKTGADSSVHISLADGTLMVAGAETRLNNASASDQWLFDFDAGVLWVLLYGQRLTFSTPLGRVSVTGTAIALKYWPGPTNESSDDVWVIYCLRGACQFEDGAQSVLLGDLDLLRVTGDGSAPTQAQASRADVDEFIAVNPEAGALLASQRANAPQPSTTPQFTGTPSPTLKPGEATATATHTPALSATAAPTDTPPASPTKTRPPTLVPTWTSRFVSITDTPAPPTNPPPQPTNPPPPPPTDTPIPPTDTPVPPPTDTVEPSRTPVPTRTP